MKRDSLCRSCYSISRRLAKAEAERRVPTHFHSSEYQYRVAKRLKEIAQLEGEVYGDLDRQEIDGMQLEMEFRFLSRRLLGKEMFFGCSDTFDWDFKPKQRRILMSFLAVMGREYFKKRRWPLALTAADLNDDEWQACL